MRDRPISPELMKQWLEVAPMATTNIVVMNGPYVLLLKRKNPPERDKWFTPGGILTKDGVIERQALEILEDETGIKACGLSLLAVDDEFFDEGYGTEDVHLVTVVFKLRVFDKTVETNTDHYSWSWYAVTSLPLELNPSVRKWILMAVKEEVERDFKVW